MMRLTTQMQAELETIQGRIECIKNEVILSVIEDFERFGGVSFQTDTKNEIFYEELNTYKVKMENILCETDDKEQDQEWRARARTEAAGRQVRRSDRKMRRVGPCIETIAEE